MTDKIAPIQITIEDTNKVYTLEFSRDTVVWLNNHGFVREDFNNNMEEMLPLLFFGAFRMHHKSVSRAETDKVLYEYLGGLTKDEGERLIELYNAPRNSMFREDEDSEDEDTSKNRRASVQL